VTAGADFWIVRAQDPDKTVPGRIWTTEIAVVQESNQDPQFTLRLVAGSTEPTLTIEPHVPGVVLQLVQSPGLSSGNFRHLSDKPVVIRSEQSAQLLIDALGTKRYELIDALAAGAASRLAVAAFFSASRQVRNDFRNQ
jgi:hypothetical protein